MKILFEYDEMYYRETPEYPEYFKKLGHEVITFPSCPEKIDSLTLNDIKELTADCDIINRQNLRIDNHVLEFAPNLKLVTTFGAGFGGVDVEACGRRGIPVVNGRGGASSVAELSVAMMLSLSKKLAHYDHEMRQNIWEASMGNELTGKTVGVVGVGAIGSQLIKIVCNGFDAKVLAYDVIQNPILTEKYGVEFVDLETLCKKSDYISLHTPLLPATKGMINKRLFNMMKPTSFIINVSRGPVIVEDDLYDALKNGIISGAGLDVFDSEPPVTNRFSSMDNVVMTPHTGAYTPETAKRIAALHIQTIEDVIAGREISGNIVNKEFLK